MKYGIDTMTLTGVVESLRVIIDDMQNNPTTRNKRLHADHVKELGECLGDIAEVWEHAECEHD